MLVAVWLIVLVCGLASIEASSTAAIENVCALLQQLAPGQVESKEMVMGEAVVPFTVICVPSKIMSIETGLAGSVFSSMVYVSVAPASTTFMAPPLGVTMTAGVPGATSQFWQLRSKDSRALSTAGSSGKELIPQAGRNASHVQKYHLFGILLQDFGGKVTIL